MTMTTRHRLEQAAMELESSAVHHSNPSYPWYDRKAASAFRRAAKIMRKALEES